MTLNSTRKGAVRATDIPSDVLDGLSRGVLSSLTLTECLALDQAQLARSVLPQLTPSCLEEIEHAQELGILKRMSTIGALLWRTLGEQGLIYCQAHQADTVRGWACFMIGARTDLELSLRLDAMQAFADDMHFGVREWAWMATRPHLVQDLPRAITLLQPWTEHPSERIRRFACEALRPRGVWCSHIAILKETPDMALPILTALRADPSTYVQDSVANWLNDAAKTQADWVRQLCKLWLQASPQQQSTIRICKRGMRNIA